MLIDHERGIYEPRWPQVSAYAEDAKIHISKAAKWFGFQDSCSPLDILRQTSRMEWLILRGIQDVTKEGIRKFEDDDVEPVKPSSQADIDRAVVLAHLRSLDLSQVLRDNEHELDVNEYQTLEDCIKALEGELSAAKPPKK